MAYDTEKLKKQALDLIEKKRLFFTDDVWPLMGIAKGTYYAHKLHEMNEIKEALHKNRVAVKSSMRSKWYKSDAPGLQVALYKLIGTEEEYHRLANTAVRISQDDQPIFTSIDLEDPKPGEESKEDVEGTDEG